MLYIYLHALASLIDMAYETQFYVILKIKIEITRNKINIKKQSLFLFILFKKAQKKLIWPFKFRFLHVWSLFFKVFTIHPKHLFIP